MSVDSNFQSFFEAATHLALALTPALDIVAVSDAYLRESKQTRASLLGRNVFEACFFDDTQVSLRAAVEQSCEIVRATAQPHRMATQRNYFVALADTTPGFDARAWRPVTSPVLGASGEVIFLLHQVEMVAPETASDPARTEDALRRSQEQLAKAIAVSKVGFYDWDIVHNVVSYSEQMKLDWDIDTSGSLQDALERIHPEDRTFVSRQIEAAVAHGERFSTEYRVMRRDGRVIWVEAEGSISYDAAGVPIRFFGTSLDITERRQREDQSRAITELAPQFIWVSNEQGAITYSNAQLLDFLGVAQASLLGDKWLSTVHPDDRAHVVDTWKTSLATGKPYEIEFRMQSKHGDYGWFLNRATPLHDKTHGRIDRWLGISFEISDRKRVEAQLQAELATLETIFTDSPASMAILRGPSLIFEKINTKQQHLFAGRALLGKPFKEALPEVTGQAFYTNLLRVFETGKSFDMREAPLVLPRGPEPALQEAFFDYTFSRVNDAEGRPYGVYAHATEVTSHVLDRQRLEQSEARFRLMADTLPHIVWVASAEGGIIYASAGWYAYTGYTLEQTTGYAWGKALHPDDLQQTIDAWNMSLATGNPISAEYRLRGKDGSYRHHLLKGLPVRDDNGQLVHWLGTITDIHDQNSANEQLVSVIEGMNDSFYAFDADWIITHVNSNFERMAQCKRQDILGKNNWDAFADSKNTVYFTEYTHVMQTRAPSTFEAYYEPLALWTAVNAVPTPDGGVAVFLRDVTAQKKAELELKASEERFRLYAEAMPQMAFIANKAGEIIYFNQQFFDYTGVGRELEGWGWRDYPIVHPDDLPRTVDVWSKSLATGAPYRVEYLLRRHDNTYRWHLGRAVPLRNPRGEITQWFGTNTDIHDQKRDQEKLREALRARDELLSICSHELRTPVTSMKLSTQLFKRRLAKKDPGVMSIDRIQRMVEQSEQQLDRLTRLIEEMLDFSRISGGKLRLNRETVDLFDIVSETLERNMPQFEAASTAATLDTTVRVCGMWDRFRVEQVITNLLSNALKYGAGHAVRLSLEETSDAAILHVRDGGMGISQHDQERIFEPYERAVSVQNISGLGMGLYISSQIVRAHGGAMSVSSAPGQGATFSVTLPKNAPATPA